MGITDGHARSEGPFPLGCAELLSLVGCYYPVLPVKKREGRRILVPAGLLAITWLTVNARHLLGRLVQDKSGRNLIGIGVSNLGEQVLNV